jgi:glyoxylase-like metal-dependent hydrolase (beta-lactamase superfamily II)
MHAMTDLDCEKYRHPDTARARRRDTYADHGVSEDERGDLAHHLTRWLPYLHSVVEASRRLRAVADLRPRQVLPGHGTPFADPLGRIEAILRTKVRRLQKIRRAIGEQPRSIVELADLLVAKAILAHQRQLAINETLAHVAYLRWSGAVERRTRPDGVYEWYATADTPLDVAGLTAP